MYINNSPRSLRRKKAYHHRSIKNFLHQGAKFSTRKAEITWIFLDPTVHPNKYESDLRSNQESDESYLISLGIHRRMRLRRRSLLLLLLFSKRSRRVIHVVLVLRIGGGRGIRPEVGVLDQFKGSPAIFQNHLEGPPPDADLLHLRSRLAWAGRHGWRGHRGWGDACLHNALQEIMADEGRERRDRVDRLGRNWTVACRVVFLVLLICLHLLVGPSQ